MEKTMRTLSAFFNEMKPLKEYCEEIGLCQFPWLVKEHSESTSRFTAAQIYTMLVLIDWSKAWDEAAWESHAEGVADMLGIPDAWDDSNWTDEQHKAMEDGISKAVADQAVDAAGDDLYYFREHFGPELQLIKLYGDPDGENDVTDAGCDVESWQVNFVDGMYMSTLRFEELSDDLMAFVANCTPGMLEMPVLVEEPA